MVEDLKNTSYTNFASELVSDAETKRELGLTYNEAGRIQDLKKKVDPNCVFVRNRRRPITPCSVRSLCINDCWDPNIPILGSSVYN